VISPILAALLASAACLLPPGDSPPAEGRPEATLAALAGDYEFVDGFDRASITLNPEGRFTFVLWGGCLVPCDQNRGVAKIVSGRLILTPEGPNKRVKIKGKGPNDRGETKGMDTRFVPVRWGRRQFLVIEERGQDFCNQVNLGGGSYGDGNSTAYFRLHDGEWKARGLPEVPKEWEPMLLKTPLGGQVVEVLAGDRARVDLGSERGIREGMVLQVIPTGPAGYALFGLRGAKVVEVGTKTCVIELKPPVSPENQFTKGQKVFSGLLIGEGRVVIPAAPARVDQ
jgi:hypothetical protein